MIRSKMLKDYLYDKYNMSSTDYTELPLPTDPFSVSVLQTKLQAGKFNHYVDAIEYIAQYYFENANGATYYKYNPITNDFEFKEKADFKNEVLNKTDDNKDITSYFKTNSKIYEVVSEIHNPRHYKIGNYYFINLCQGLLHKNVKPFNEYSDHLKECVQNINNTILKIYCNDDTDLFNALIKWYAQMIMGVLTGVILYLKSPEGTGKSTITDFIMQYVVGTKVSISPNTECITSNFNKCLMGKILVVFEELPVFTSGQWAGVSTKLKGYATNPTIQFRDLFEKSIVATNVFNCIINTNVEAIKNSEQRRIVIMPINTSRMKDTHYWGNFKNNYYNNEVGEAYYAFLKGIDISNYYAQRDFPITEQKKNIISQMLPSPYKFLKSYILANKEIGTVKPKDLYNDFKTYCDNNELKYVQFAEFVDKLKDIQIVAKKTCAVNREGVQERGTNFFTITLEHLKSYADKLHWISDYDETEEADGNELVSIPRNEYDKFLQWKMGVVNKAQATTAEEVEPAKPIKKKIIVKKSGTTEVNVPQATIEAETNLIDELLE